METVFSTIKMAMKRIAPQRAPARTPPIVASLGLLLEKALAEAKKGEAVTRKRAPRTGRRTRGVVASIKRRARPILFSRSAASTT